MFLYDLVDMAELQGFVRQVAAEVEQDTFALAQFLGNNNIDDIEYRVSRRSRNDVDAATVRAWDAESGIAERRAEFRRIMGELPPISRKIRLGEEERLRRRSLSLGNEQPIVDAVYDDAANMARAVAARIEMFRGEALRRGRVDINENGVVQPVDFGRDPALDFTVAALWSDTANSEPITDETEAIQLYADTNGERPGFALTSTRVINSLLRSLQVRTLAQTDAAAPSLVSLNTVNTVRTAYNLPPFVTYDAQVRVNGTRQRVIPDNVIIYLPANPGELGETLLGTTAESLELVGASQLEQAQAPGLTAVVDKTFDPVATWTLAVAIALPVLYEPDLTMAMEVLPAAV